MRNPLVWGFVAVFVPALACYGEDLTSLAPSADTSLLESNPNNNLGGLAAIPAGTTQSGRSRALFRFDLTGIPRGAVVTAAELTVVAVLENSQHPGSIFALNRVLRDWGEGIGSLSNAGDPATTNAATWNNRFHPATPWGTPGSAASLDYVAPFSATNFIDALTSYTFGPTPAMAADVQLWINNPATNFGWILMSLSEATNFTVRRFASREDPVRFPVLAVRYVLPPVIAAPFVSGEQIHFSFVIDSNRTYTVETLNPATQSSWSVLTNFTARLTEATVQVSDWATNEAALYRVRSP